MRTFIRSTILLSLSFYLHAGTAFSEELNLENIRSDFQEAISHYNYNDEPVVDTVSTGAAAPEVGTPANNDTDLESEEILDIEGKFFDEKESSETPVNKSNLRVRSR